VPVATLADFVAPPCRTSRRAPRRATFDLAAPTLGAVLTRRRAVTTVAICHSACARSSAASSLKLFRSFNVRPSPRGTFRFQRGHASCAGGGHRLAIDPILHVAAANTLRHWFCVVPGVVLM
jgi:hypothetical protein